MKKHTQKDAVLNYLQTHNVGLTHREAEDLFGIMRLAAIVCVLKKDGYDIRTKSERVPNRYGGHSTIARYVLNGLDN